MILYHALEVDNVIQNTVGRSRFTLILYISLFELQIEATILWPILCRFFWSNCQNFECFCIARHDCASKMGNFIPHGGISGQRRPGVINQKVIVEKS